MGTKKPFLKKSEQTLLLWVAFAVILFLISRLLGAIGDQHNWAVITLDGEVIYEINLANHGEQSFISLAEEYGVPVNFELSEHRIRFVAVTCPDHICEGYGFVSNEGETAVCLPNRVVLSIYTPQEMLGITDRQQLPSCC